MNSPSMKEKKEQLWEHDTWLPFFLISMKLDFLSTLDNQIKQRSIPTDSIINR